MFRGLNCLLWCNYDSTLLEPFLTLSFHGESRVSFGTFFNRSRFPDKLKDKVKLTDFPSSRFLFYSREGWSRTGR